ncbi:hypothetical protein PR202_ga27057 [Eleusine coracana subsp. coracana]|uniref:Uncharacterized protein n=1 Tax=Eleusine coracana subsp. coracana TaxID=191504 RepID=A0AAV5DE84_ELECO|nr:hypothetical protein PR202_ga27057 [Eleusine coracana subsp. coracana]
MEEDEQEAGPEPEEEPQRCGRHPSQLLTGICSSCLMERLSSVRDQPEAEIVEIGAAAEASAAAADTGKLRKTLMLLFQLDDSCGGSGVARPWEGDDGSQVLADIGADSGGGDRGGRRKSGSWLRSILPKRGMRWRRSGGWFCEGALAASHGKRRRWIRGVAAAAPPPAALATATATVAVLMYRWSGSQASGAPSDWRVGRDPSKSSVEPPRHSWDGAMVGRAFACSFACLEDPPETARTARRSNAEETVGEARGGVAGTRNGGRLSVDEGRCIRGRGRADAGLEMAVSSVGRRRSNRWSRVWDRSITSPLKEFVRKGEHVLERSLSESRREVRRGKNAEAADIGGEIQPGRSNGHVSGRASQGATRSSQAASMGDAQNFPHRLAQE